MHILGSPKPEIMTQQHLDSPDLPRATLWKRSSAAGAQGKERGGDWLGDAPGQGKVMAHFGRELPGEGLPSHDIRRFMCGLKT